MGVINDAALRYVAWKDVGSLTEKMMEFLPRRLAIRYLLERKRGHRREVFHADVVYLQGFIGGTHELLRLRRTLTFGQTLDDILSLNFDELRGSEEHIKEAVAHILKGWKEKAVEHEHFEKWLKPKEFVGVLKIGESEAREFPEHDTLFTFYHALLATHIAHHAKFLKDAVSLDYSFRHRAGSVQRMSDRFSAFAAQSRHLSVGAILGE
ncbi:MAG: hypothetical protein HYY92_01665 [Parcubacteria group bacterium]|nr:hypothetical protein [Parcubacteria group bacterium]